MRTCYLHLGMPKTGSSSIQDAFFRYDQDGLSYAKMGGRNHGMPLATIFSANPAALPEFRWQETGDDEISKRAAKMRKLFDKSMASRKDILFSGEGIVDRLKPDEFGNLVATLKQHFDRIVAIAYIRPLTSLAASQFQQRVKTGLRRFHLPSPDYRKRFEPVITHVGGENTTFVRFDRSDLVGGDIVEDFAHRLGLQSAPKTGISANESLSAETLGAIYAFNKFTAPLLRPKIRTKLRQEIQDTLRDSGSIRFGLGEQLIQRHLERHAEDVAWMESVCGFDVKGTVRLVPDPIENEQQLLRVAARAGEKS